MSIYDNPSCSGDGPRYSRILQWMRISTGSQDLTIINVHGMCNGKGKTDSPDRIKQSHRIASFIKNLDTPCILCGDFNILPNTISASILAENMQDLIAKNNVQSTRSSFYKKPEKHTDYIFTSKNIKIDEFTVFEDEVSDHLPLYIKFSL